MLHKSEVWSSPLSLAIVSNQISEAVCLHVYYCACVHLTDSRVRNTNLCATMGVDEFATDISRSLEYDSCLFDLKNLEETLQKNSDRLFVSDGETCVQFIEPGDQRMFNRTKPLQSHADEHAAAIVEGLSALQEHLNVRIKYVGASAC